jgi:hypothetical protein
MKALYLTKELCFLAALIVGLSFVWIFQRLFERNERGTNDD